MYTTQPVRNKNACSSGTRWTWRDLTFCPCGTAVLGDSGVPRKSSSYEKLTTGLSWPAQPGNVRQAYLFPTKESAISTPLKISKKVWGKTICSNKQQSTWVWTVRFRTLKWVTGKSKFAHVSRLIVLWQYTEFWHGTSWHNHANTG